MQKIRQVASYLSREEPSNPNAYRLARIYAWKSIEALPLNENGKTRIPPPDGQVKNILSQLTSKEQWKNLLRAAEDRVNQFIFWLDLNRLVAEALINLGDKHIEAQEAVCQETAFFLYRLSGLENLTFSDGTPFADDETKQWLKGIQFKALGAETPILPSPSGAMTKQEEIMKEEIKKAQALAKKRKIVDAVDLLQHNLQNSHSQREQLLWRFALSQILIKSKRLKVALPHLEQIIQDISLYRLEEWDPQLALQGLKIVWTGLNAQADPTSQSKAVDTLSRIARLNPVEALRIGK